MPIIIYGPRYYGLNPLFQEFIRRHECAHLSIPSSNEVEVNCHALISLRNDGLTEHQENAIANWQVSQGAIGVQYGGTGYNFWSSTLECAGPRS